MPPQKKAVAQKPPPQEPKWKTCNHEIGWKIVKGAYVSVCCEKKARMNGFCDVHNEG